MTPDQIDEIIADLGCRNAAGGIYTGSVYQFAKEVAQASRRAAMEEAKQLCLGREARVDPVKKGDCEWFTGFSEGIKTGARHCACEIDEAIRALAASDKDES